jgi:hypothetical protein
MTVRELEREALEHFRAGTGWAAFWFEHGPAVMQLPDNEWRARFIGRLFKLVVGGDAPAELEESGMSPPDPPLPHDSKTEARYLGCQEVPR